jgi:hypothetical protein
MTDYTAEDGLNILTYLRLTNLTEQERKVFGEKWDGVYKMRKDLIMTIWTLYSEVLPFACGDGDRKSFIAAIIRDAEFGERLEESDLDKKLKEGTPLKEIFTNSPERFFRTN